MTGLVTCRFVTVIDSLGSSSVSCGASTPRAVAMSFQKVCRASCGTRHRSRRGRRRRHEGVRGGAVLFESCVELRGHRLVRGGPFGIAAAENGVRQLVKRVLSRLVHPMVELDRVVRW